MCNGMSDVSIIKNWRKKNRLKCQNSKFTAKISFQKKIINNSKQLSIGNPQGKLQKLKYISIFEPKGLGVILESRWDILFRVCKSKWDKMGLR